MQQSLEKRVLVALVGKNDPASSRGIGPILTAAIGLQPVAFHLLYQPKPYPENTEENLQQLVDKLKKDPDFRHVPVQLHPLNLPDLRDYEQLVKVLPPLLKEIELYHPGQVLYFVAGHPQVRLITWLILASFIVHGIPLEVKDPDPTVQPSPKSCRERLQVRDLKVFTEFIQRAVEAFVFKPRLVVDVQAQQASFNGKPLKLRRRAGEARTFWILFLLAFHARFAEDPAVSSSDLKRFVYQGCEPSNVPKAIQSINKLAGQELVSRVRADAYQLCLHRTQIQLKGEFITVYRQKCGEPPDPMKFPHLPF